MRNCATCGARLPDHFLSCPMCGDGLGRAEGRARSEAVEAAEQAFIEPLFRFPPITMALLVLNAVVFYLLEVHGGSTGEVLLLIFGAKARSPVFHGQWWRLISASFLHIGWLHILVNSVTLIQLGMVCENLFGKVRFLVLYVLSGMGGFLLSAAMTDTISAGASASLAGLMGALLAFGFSRSRRVPPALRRHFTWYLLPWVVLMLGLGVYYPGIDNWAHLGGLMSGTGLALILDDRLVRTRPSRKAGVAAAAMAVATGWLLVAAAYHGVVRARSDLALLDGPSGTRDTAGAVAVLSRFLDDDPGDGFLYYLRGQARYRAGDWSGATDDYRAAIGAGYDGARVKNALAWVLALSHDPNDGGDQNLETAIQLARAAVRDERRSAYLNTLGWIYYLRGQPLAAIAQLEAAYRRASRPAWWHGPLAGLRRVARVLHLYDAAAPAPPALRDSQEACLDLYMLSLAYRSRGDPATAAERFRQAEALWSRLTGDVEDIAPFRESARAAAERPADRHDDP